MQGRGLPRGRRFSQPEPCEAVVQRWYIVGCLSHPGLCSINVSSKPLNAMATRNIPDSANCPLEVDLPRAHPVSSENSNASPGSHKQPAVWTESCSEQPGLTLVGRFPRLLLEGRPGARAHSCQGASSISPVLPVVHTKRLSSA